VSEGAPAARRPFLAFCGAGALVALSLALFGLWPEADFSVKGPLDLIKFVFLLAPMVPFLLVAVFAWRSPSPWHWGVATALLLSCAVYPLAREEYRADASMHALTYLVVPFLQTAVASAACLLLAFIRQGTR